MFFLSPSELKIGLETELELFNRLVCLAWRVWCANFGCFVVFSRYLIELVGAWSFVVQKIDDPQFLAVQDSSIGDIVSQSLSESDF